MSINDFVIENGVLKKYKGPGGDVVIPDSVTSIAGSAFAGCSSLTSVTIPDGVTSIGYKAFYDCSSLAGIVIPESVTSIAGSAFAGCSSLTSIVIPESVTNIGDSAFYVCKGLADADGFAIIRNVLYSYHGNGGDVVIPDSVTSIGNKAFKYCSSLTSIVIPNGVTSIGAEAFLGCNNLRSAVIPESVTGIGTSAFQNCGSLKSVVIPEGVMSIGNEAFELCGSLISVVIPDSVAVIGEKAFAECRFLKSIVIPEGVTSIGRSAFYMCKSLTNVMIQDSVASIGDSAFCGCKGLADTDGFVIVRNVLYNYYGKGGDAMIPEGVTNIDAFAFDNCSRLTSIVIPESVTSIGDYAFHDTGITDAAIPEKVGKLGSSAFAKCGGLKTVTVLGPTKIGDCAFEDCASLETVIFKSKNAEIDWSAFRGTKAAVIVGEDDDMHCCACGSTRYSDNSAWYNNGACSIEYDNELIRNGPKFKYRLPARLLGAISRLHDPVNLGAAERQGYVDLLKKNAKKLPELIDPLNCPWMSELLESEGILSETVRKAAEKKHVKKTEEVPAEIPKPQAELKSNDEYAALLQPIKTRAADALSMIKDGMLFAVRLADGSAAPAALVRYVIAAYASQQKVPARRVAEADEASSLLNMPSFVSLIHKLYVCKGESTSLIPVICRFGDSKTLEILTRAFPKWKGVSGKSYQKALLYAIHLSDLNEAQKWISTNFTRNIKGLLFEEYLDSAKFPPQSIEYFMNTPQLSCYAEKLVWMQGSKTFIVKDGKPSDASGSPVELSDKPIVMAHTLELSPDTVDAWRRYLTAGGIEQPFVQMWEPVYRKADIMPDRYRGITLPRSAFLRQKRRGIRIYDRMIEWESYNSEEALSIRGFDVEYRLNSMNVELTSIIPKNKSWRRRENSLIAYLDYVACDGLVRKDDTGVEPLLRSLPQARIMSLLELARSSNAVNVTAMLLELNNRNFPDFDPMAEFTLDEL